MFNRRQLLLWAGENVFWKEEGTVLRFHKSTIGILAI